MSATSLSHLTRIGWWRPEAGKPENDVRTFNDALRKPTEPIYVIEKNGRPSVCHSGAIVAGSGISGKDNAYPLLAYVPPLLPESMGDAVFKKTHGLRYPLVAGAMANGITSVQMIEAMGRAGMIGFFGAGGLTIEQIEAAIHRIKETMDGLPYGFNLIHSPYSPALESATVALYLRHSIRRVSAAAFMDMTLPLIHYRLKGIHRDRNGHVICPNHVFAKVSRIEVARKFLSPPPEKIVAALIDQKLITREEAALAAFVPVADDLTAEADSGGHTDNRPAISLLPTMLALRDEISERFDYHRPICVGLAGGIATPASVAGAFAMGAAYVLTGSINQACIESGTSDIVRKMLADAGQADVAMAPSADMFEMGVKVQVLKRGTMFAQRAAKLYELYSQYRSLEDLPPDQKQMLERTLFKKSLDAEWEQTVLFFQERDPAQLSKAASDPHHKMALVFRSYLGQSSLWAKTGNPERIIDYQIWCGPAIGAFNEWTRGSFLQQQENRKIVTVSMNLLIGATVIMRRSWITAQGISLSPGDGRFKPLPLPELYDTMETEEGPGDTI
jgi:trans-AT polyketide synthase, acyltransferase and oxidoreductase domains